MTAWGHSLAKFCAKCGTYIPINRLDCPKCGAPEERSTKQMNPKEITVNDVLENFPAPSLRPYQKEIIIEAVEALGSGKRCILLAAPTGFGKSYVNAAFSSLSRSFYSTPQLGLIDQILGDPYLKSRFVEIKGRQNYQCYYNPQRRVHVGKCETEDYPCKERFQVCPYWIQKIRALKAPSILLTTAYLIGEGQTEGLSESYLGTRALMVLDEAHNIEEQCLSHISVRLTPFTIPHEIYNQFLPQLRDVKTDAELKEFLEALEVRLTRLLEQMKRVTETSGLTVGQVQDKGTIERYLVNYELYKRSRSEWVWQIRNDQLLLQPVYAREFMKDLLWKRAEYYIISSATILHPVEFTELTGLRDIVEDDEIAFLQVPSTFPVENRPVIDVSVGPLSRSSLEMNMLDAVRVVEEVLRREPGNVAIHCHSYRHQEWLVQNLSNEIQPRLIVHNSRDREEKLREWVSSRGKVFVSVAFSEGQDWKYDICDAQILLKVPFPDLSDRRVKRRLELGHWQWYDNQAMLEVIQAYGRAIRAEDDRARFYIVDGSFMRLIGNCWPFIPNWFKEALPASLTP